MRGNVLLVWDRMGDYHRARWKAVEKVFNDRTVFAADLGASDNLYGWTSTEDQLNYLRLSEKGSHKFDLKRIFRFIKTLYTKNIAVVCIAGYGRPEYVIFLLYAWLSRRKVILFAESWYPSGFFFDFIKSCYLKCCCHGFLVSGTRAFTHFTRRMRIPASKIKIGYSVVDNKHFALPPDFSIAKKKKILLCMARFSQEKNLCLLIEGFIKSEMERQGWELTLVGGGPGKEELALRATGHQIDVLTWQEYLKLPKLYHEASVFILPSTFEPWGLAVNEAMAASLPVILSNDVGCLPDLLSLNDNGWFFASENEQDLVGILNRVSSMSILDLTQMGDKSRQRIDHFSTFVFAENLKALIETIHE